MKIVTFITLFFTTGTVELNLNHMPSPAKKSRQCSLKQLPDTEGSGDHDMISLFEQKRVNGWWPCMSEETGERELTVSCCRKWQSDHLEKKKKRHKNMVHIGVMLMVQYTPFIAVISGLIGQIRQYLTQKSTAKLVHDLSFQNWIIVTLCCSAYRIASWWRFSGYRTRLHDFFCEYRVVNI